MKNLLLLVSIIFCITVNGQKKSYQDGEWFKFKVSYGFINAGYATLQVNNAILKGKEVYHIKGYGKNTGISRIFFKVEDIYETYMDKQKDIPYRFIRNIDEGGHTKKPSSRF